MKAAGPAALFFLAAALAFAQSTGTLTGTVTDPSGAVVPNAEVTCRNVNTGVSQSAKSNAEGLFRFPDLPIGICELAVTQPGFERLVRSGVDMITGRTVDIPLQLKVDEFMQSVEVAAGARHPDHLLGSADQLQQQEHGRVAAERAQHNSPASARRATSSKTPA